MANPEGADLQSADVTSNTGEGAEQQVGVGQDQGATGHHEELGECDIDPKEGQIHPKLDSPELVVPGAAAGGGGGRENYQGPHRWRERLRPVRRSDGRRLTGIRDSRTADNDTSATVERSESFDRPWKDGRKLNRDDRIDDNKIRERLKSMPGWKKDWSGRKQNGPMVAKHVPNSGNGPTSNSQAASSNIPVRLSKKRHLSPHAESAFTRNVVNNVVSYSGSRRRLSPHNSFQFRQPGVSAGFYSGRRTPSPNTLHDPNTQSELSNKRIAKVLRARLYLLQQMGPNSFMIGGDSPEHKYKVIIGPQSCSCGKGPHCAHLLFVMLRVFQVRENDSCLWAKTLKNFEVEALFGMYHSKRSLRLAARHQRKKTKELLPETHGNNSDEPTTPTEGDNGSSKDEEDTCPICLLEMLEGESLLKCDNGCQNRLHHHCITIWFEECRRQGETLNCPLCRAEWKGSSNDNNNTTETIENGEPPIAPPNTRASSPTPEPRDDARLPHADPIPPEYMSTAEPWIQVLGEELVACLFSRNWSIRETALKHLSREVVATLLRGMGEGRSGVVVSPVRQSATHQMLNTCCSILAFMCADPVYKVFVACLRMLRTMMSYTPCRGIQQRQRLQALLKPIIDTVVLKCTDGNRRTSQLSISTVVELARGQEGELAVGREIVNPGIHGLGGLKFVIQCVTEAYQPDSVQWQWLLGRMCILERLFEEFCEQFVFQGVNMDEDDDADLDLSVEMNPGRPPGYHFIIAVSQFTIKAVGYSHTRVAKLARRLFLVATHYAAHDPSATAELETMLANTEARLAPAMRRKFRKIVQDNRVSQASEELDFPSDLSESDSVCVSVPSPSISPVSTPRCNSPESFKLVNVPLEDGQSEASCSGNVAPAVPPNTPRHVRRARPEPEGSSDIVDSLNTSGRSEPRDDAHEEGRSELIQGETTHAQAPNTPEIQAVVSSNPQEVMGLAEMEAVVDVEESMTASHSTAEEVCPPPNLPQSLRLKPSSPGEVLPAPSQGELTPVSTPRSRTSSLRDSLSTDGVVSLCDAETIHPDESSHRQAPVCRCSAGLSLSEVTTTKLRRSVSDTETPSGSRGHGGNGVAEGKPHPRPRYSRSVMLTEDLDFRFSPPPCDQPVSFKTEVATPSPKHSPSTTADQAASSDPEYKCKEEVELEEALALAKALDVSSKQDPTPVVPGLTPTDREEVITIRIQPEEKDQGDGLTHDRPCTSQEEPKLYFENIHWVKGLLLGTGAYSTCYQARDVQTGVIMAVKQISFCRNSPSEQEKVVEAITEEIHMMSRLNHPNVVRILGATKQGCHFNMFVEWMAGGSIAFLLDQYGAFSESVIISYIQQVLRGLAYLHDNHILHRDLKGANLLTDSTGQRLRIGDFGAAARLASRATGAGEFQGQLLGTIAFMAPEVLRGENYGRSCDVWSVGCVMIEMATRKPPWNAKDVTNHLKLIFKIATCDQPPPVPPNMSPPVKDVMLRCLELNRTERPAAKELLLHPLFTQYQAPR